MMTLVSMILNTTFEAHNALEDAKNLQEMVKNEKLPSKNKIHLHHGFPVEHIVKYVQISSISEENLPFLHELCSDKQNNKTSIINNAMAPKMAKVHYAKGTSG